MPHPIRPHQASSVTVVIVNWNGGALLGQCLQHLSQQSVPPTRILLMDNGSTDGSAELAQRIDGVTVRRLGANLGFAAANNRALAECDTEFVALLNPDALPSTEWLAGLLAAARRHPEVAAFGSRQVAYGMPGVLDGVGDVYHFSGLVWRRGHGRAERSADRLPREIFSPCAGAALYRREAVLKVGGFDEDYFCYVEDIDLGFRLRLAGLASKYVPDALVYHVGAASSGGKHSDFAVYHGHRNLVWTFVKDMPGPMFWALLPAHVALNLLSVGWFAMRGQGRVVLRAKWDALRGIPRMWRKRRLIQAGRRATLSDIWRVLDRRLNPSNRQADVQPAGGVS
jgi:GT2 family glycosyltransferase